MLRWPAGSPPAIRHPFRKPAFVRWQLALRTGAPLPLDNPEAELRMGVPAPHAAAGIKDNRQRWYDQDGVDAIFGIENSGIALAISEISAAWASPGLLLRAW